MTDLQGASQEMAAPVSPSQGPTVVPSGPTQPSGEAGQGATGTENFIPQGVDINTLPPQLRAELDRINKEMVRGFTAKTQELAEERKKYADYDSVKQKASFYDQFSSQEDAVKWWNEFVERANGQTGEPKVDDQSQKLQAEVQEIKTELQRAKMIEVVDSFAGAKDDKGELINPDVEALSSISIGKVGGGEFSLLRAAVELAPGENPQEKLANGYKAAKAVRDAILEEGRKQGMGKMLAKVRNSSNVPTLSTDKSGFTGDPKKLSTREARELAQKGVVFSS